MGEILVGRVSMLDDDIPAELFVIDDMTLRLLIE